MIRMQNAGFAYDGRTVLRGLNLHIRPGEFVAVAGPNGAGKTSFAKLLNGLNRPTEGEVFVDGLDTRRARVSALSRSVGFLFQNPDRQLCRTTVREELLFGLRLHVRDEAEAARRLERALADFALDPEENPLTAARAERQRIALASVVALGPRLLVLDEPTTGLSHAECRRTMEIVRRLHREGTTVVLISTWSSSCAMPSGCWCSRGERSARTARRTTCCAGRTSWRRPRSFRRRSCRWPRPWASPLPAWTRTPRSPGR